MDFIKFFITFFIFNTYAGQGVVVVHEAPLLQTPSLEGKVIQTVRKGQHIYIHNKYFKNGPLEGDYFLQYEKELESFDNDPYPNFYLTLDKTGQNAYIPKKYIKLIFNDEREASQNITPYSPDPLDYRLAEPLPRDYPFIREDHYRASLSVLAGPDLKSGYAYSEYVDKETFGVRAGARLIYTKKARWDSEDRFYFGGVFHFWSSRSEYALFNQTNTIENKGQIGLGPLISYDTWRSERFLLNLDLSFSLNLNRNIVEQTNSSDVKEKRLFSSYSFSPRVGTTFHLREIFENGNFFLGADVQIMLPTSLESSSAPNETAMWNTYGSESDQINYPFMAIWSAFTGFQFQY